MYIITLEEEAIQRRLNGMLVPILLQLQSGSGHEHWSHSYVTLSLKIENFNILVCNNHSRLPFHSSLCCSRLVRVCWFALCWLLTCSLALVCEYSETEKANWVVDQTQHPYCRIFWVGKWLYFSFAWRTGNSEQVTQLPALWLLFFIWRIFLCFSSSLFRIFGNNLLYSRALLYILGAIWWI